MFCVNGKIIFSLLWIWLLSMFFRTGTPLLNCLSIGKYRDCFTGVTVWKICHFRDFWVRFCEAVEEIAFWSAQSGQKEKQDYLLIWRLQGMPETPIKFMFISMSLVLLVLSHQKNRTVHLQMGLISKVSGNEMRLRESQFLNSRRPRRPLWGNLKPPLWGLSW